MKPVYKEKYPHLFEPMYVGRNKVRFNNRVRVAPIGTGATGGGEDSDGRINTFGIDFWMRYIQGGFSSVALPMEVPMEGSQPSLPWLLIRPTWLEPRGFSQNTMAKDTSCMAI